MISGVEFGGDELGLADEPGDGIITGFVHGDRNSGMITLKNVRGRHGYISIRSAATKVFQKKVRNMSVRGGEIKYGEPYAQRFRRRQPPYRRPELPAASGQ